MGVKANPLDGGPGPVAVCTDNLYSYSMAKVNITELRQNLAAYLVKVRKGEEVEVTARGKVIARIVPEENRREAAKRRLAAVRKKARVGDLMSPSGEVWNAELGRF